MDSIKPKQKILRVIARLNVGGPAIHTILLTEGMNDNNFETKLVSGVISDGEGDMSYLAKDRDVNIHDFPYLQRELSPVKDWVALMKMYTLIKSYQPDIIHTHTAKAGFIGRFSAILYNTFHGKKVKTVHTFHGHVFHSYFSALKTNIFLFLEKFLAKHTNVIITITPKQQEEILNLGIGSKTNHTMVPLGLDLEKFYTQQRFCGFLHKTFNISPKKRLIGITARFTAIKNLTLFLKVAKKLLEEYDDIHFVLVGDGEDRPMLEDFSKELQIEEHVTFTGFLKELPLVYSDLSLFMLTSKNEGSPVSMIEAMSTGVPCIASRVGGVPDLITNEGEHLLCESENVDDFVRAAKTVLSNQNDITGITAERKESIYRLYHFKRLINDLSAIYLKL